MDTDYLSFFIFILITTFTPGPNNISSAVMGLNFGYRKTFRYLLGIASGFFIIMGACALLASFLLEALPRLEQYLAVIGAAYIIWLAWHTLRSSYTFDDQKGAPLGYLNGILLQLLNPKVIIYGMTIYSTFLKILPRNSFLMPLTAGCLALTSLASISTWTLFGTVIRRFMKNETVRRGTNIMLALLLVFTAIQISGILKIIR